MAISFNLKSKQTICGLVAIGVPLILMWTIWPEIRSTLSLENGGDQYSTQLQTQEYCIYYTVGERHAKVTLEAQEKFENHYPNARMCLTIHGQNYDVPINNIDKFIRDAGYGNVKLSVFENGKYIPDLSIHNVPGY